MASGNRFPAVVESELPVGSVVTASGRVSAVHKVGDPYTEDLPFTVDELVTLDDTLIDATRATKVRFNVYVGPLGEDPAAGAEVLFPGTPEAARSVLIAVSPNQRVVEIRAGKDVEDRVTDRVAQLGVTAAVSSFKDKDLIDGLVSAIRVMSAAIVTR